MEMEVTANDLAILWLHIQRMHYIVNLECNTANTSSKKQTKILHLFGVLFSKGKLDWLIYLCNIYIYIYIYIYVVYSILYILKEI